MSNTAGSGFYGSSVSNRKSGASQRSTDASASSNKLFGYNNNGAKPNGATNPYGGSNINPNPYGTSGVSNGTTLSTDQGKGDGDWFSSSSAPSAPAPAHMMNPYATSNPNVNSSSSVGNGPTSTNPLVSSTIDNSNSMGVLNPTISCPAPTHTNNAFVGPMVQMGRTTAQPNGNTVGISSNTMTPIPGMEDYDNEPPLLEELGINLDHIRTKSLAVLLPMKYAKSNIDSTIMEDDDLAGPVAFVLLLGGELLLAAKMNFGYIYGLSLFGCFGMTLVLNLLSPTDSISMWTVLSVLGYSLLPVNTLAGVNILYRIRHMGKFGVVLAALTIGWCACSSTRLFERGCGLREQRFLVAYPIALFYSAFVMLTIF